MEQTLTIKNYHNNGGDLTLKLTSSITSERIVGKVQIIKLIVTRKPDKHSSRLGMFAFVRRRPGYQSLGFSEMTLTIDRFSADGKFVSRTIVVFFDVGVENVTGEGEEEKITFIAGRKSNEFTIP
jgi:hypothetical protein